MISTMIHRSSLFPPEEATGRSVNFPAINRQRIIGDVAKIGRTRVLEVALRRRYHIPMPLHLSTSLQRIESQRVRLGKNSLALGIAVEFVRAHQLGYLPPML